MKISISDRECTCESKEGESVLHALVRSGVSVTAPCGGRHVCRKCKVILKTGRIRGDTPDGAGKFLACQGIPATDITIELGTREDQIFNEVNELNPSLNQGITPDRAGVALDIGTTTLSAQLIDLDSFAALDTYSELNDQKAFGADVMSRINAAKNGKTGELFTCINRQTEGILRHYLETTGITRVERLIVSGNTTMLHLFINTDPSGMGELPFTPVFLEEKDLPGRELSLSAGRVTLLPSISAFIGSDIVSGLAALDILGGADNSLFIDIGTNGEMALLRGDKLFCCSTAAGPAFEGAEISCGIGSVKGAINTVSLREGKVSFTTIGAAPPVGICGCGLIDSVAAMLEAGIIDETGAMDETYSEGFEITKGISVINRDIRQYQLAKSAILSGIRILCKNAGLELSAVNTVYIAGGLGFFINKQKAITAGLLPREFLNKIVVCGNSSLRGAVKCLSDPAFLSSCKRIIEKSVYTDLAADPAFMDEFAENMLF